MRGGSPASFLSYNYRCSKFGQNINFATLTGLLGSTRSTADVPAAVLKITCSPNQKEGTKIVRIQMTAFTTFLALLGIIGISPKAASAQQVPGPHPAYLHALSDLRLARAYLNQIAWPPVQRDEEHAIREIDAAIAEIKRASIDDGKDLADHPPVDVRMAPDGRFRKALELLDKAHNDTARAEDVPQARGMRDRAIGHIDQAHGTVDDAIHRIHWEEWHGM